MFPSLLLALREGLEAALIIELTDERFRAVGVEQQLIPGLKLDGSLVEFGLLENAQQRAACFQLFLRFSGPEQDRIRMPRPCIRKLKCIYIQQTVTAGGKLTAAQFLCGHS